MAKQDPDYAALVAQAEKSVKAVTDPELRRIAFQKVLDDLLGVGSVSSTPARTPKSKRTSGSQTAPKKTGPQAYISELIDEGFFKKPKTKTDVKVELENRGHHVPLKHIAVSLPRLCRQRKLRRQKGGDKNTFVYSNW